MNHGHRWLSGAASAALLLVAGAAHAQTAGQDPMEARIAALEAQLNALKADLAATRGEQAQTRQDVILLSQQTPPPAPAAAPAAPAAPEGTPSPAASGAEDPMAVLKRAKEMLDAGLITQADYDAAKAKALGL